jgi:Flp pilus assembly protein TadB
MLYLEVFGKAFVPQRVRPSLRSYLMKAGIDEVPYKFFGGLFYVSLLIALIIYFAAVYAMLRTFNPLLLAFLTFLVIFVMLVCLSGFIILVIYIYLNMQIYNRTKKLELLLPDYLQLVSSNLRGGMSLDKALWSAIQPEFGILAKEVKMVSKRVMTGNDLGEALLEFARKYDSPILSRAIDLIVSEIESGGKIADVIDRVVASLRKVAILKEEMAAQTMTYMIFIGAIVMFIAPALFALASQVISTIIGFSSQIGSVSTHVASSPFSISSKPAIDPYDFRVFAFFALAVISIFAAMIVSIIEKGDIRGGLKYIPLFMIVSVVMYLIFSLILRGLF